MSNGEHRDVQLNEVAKRFEVEADGHTAFLEYRRSGQSLVFTHTEVPKELEGKGLGSKLAVAGLNYAREHNLTVIPLCPFVSAYMRRHPETSDLLDPSYAQKSH